MFAFDSLAFTRHLERSGISRKEAEAHAEAVQTYVISEVVTKADLATTKDELKIAMDNLALRLTIRLGSMLGVGIALIAAIVKL